MATYSNPVLGVDVSMHQGVTPWATLVAGGCRYAWAKCSEGTGYTDPQWGRNRTEASRQPIPFSGYHFARADAGSGGTWQADARAEAEWFVSQGGVVPGFAPMLDMEHTVLDRSTTIAWADIWCRRVQELTGTPHVVAYWGAYFATGGGNACPNDPRLQWCRWWMPGYLAGNPVNPNAVGAPIGWSHGAQNGPRVPDLWQYTSRGRVPGYGGDLDLNHAEPQTIADLAGMAPPVPQEETMARPVHCPEFDANGAFETVWNAGRRWRKPIKDQTELHTLVAIGELETAEYVVLHGDQAWWYMALPLLPVIPPGSPRLITCAADTRWAREVAKLEPGQVGRFYWVPDRYLVRIVDDNQWNSDAYVGVPQAGEIAEPFLYNQPLQPWSMTIAEFTELAAGIAAELIAQGLTVNVDETAVANAVADVLAARLVA